MSFQAQPYNKQDINESSKENPYSDVDNRSSNTDSIKNDCSVNAVVSLPSTVAGMSSWSGQPSIKGSSESMRMALLTFSLIGVQFTWGIEMTYGTPYLLNLGLTKSRTSMVWIAGPLSGLIVQPLIGVMSDNSKSKYGRRRPIMMIGSVAVLACLIVMAWTKELVGLFLEDGPTAKSCTIWIAVLSIYAVDFVINAVMSCCRSLIVDTLPIPKQQTGSAWASRMAAFGHLIGYAAGTVDLVAVFGTSFGGETQFKKLALLAGFGLIFTCGVTSWAVTERVLLSGKDADSNKSVSEIVRQIVRMSLNLPPRIQAICWVQFWSWIGWFPFLFYNSTWVGETYFRYDVPIDLKHSKDALGDIGRIGSMALVVFSTITFTGAFILPFLIKSPDEGNVTSRPPKSIANAMTIVNRYKPDLLTAWFTGHLVFAGTMIFAPFARSFQFATTLVALCGLPWVIASWAPNAFLGVEVNRLAASDTKFTRLRSDSIDSEKSSSGNTMSPNFLRLENGPLEEPNGSTGELAGVYFGILNIYTTLPQFIGTFISTIVFSILEPGKSPELAHDVHPDEHHSTDGPNAIAVCLVIGAFSMVGAAYATRVLKKLQ